MSSALDLVKEALIEINAWSPGDSLSNDDAQLGLTKINDMRDTWNAIGLLLYEVRQETFTIVVDTQSPTIGPSGATYTSTRPIKITSATIVDTTITPNQRRPVNVMDKDAWIGRYLANDSAEFPSDVYYEPSYPNGTLHFSKAPTVAHTLELSTYLPWGVVTTLAQSLILPPAYYECALYNLALRLAGPFGFEPTPHLIRMASQSLAAVKSLNARVPKLTTDLPGRW